MPELMLAPHFLDVLAALTVAGAGAMRLSLPLLLLVILSQSMGVCNDSVILSFLCHPVALGLLVSWAVFEVVGSKTTLGQRILQSTQLILAPFVGAILAAVLLPYSGWLEVCMMITGAAIAGTLQLVQTGYIFRWGRLPLWMTLGQDLMAASLVLLALDAPWVGGVLVLILLWLALKQAYLWRWQFGLRAVRS